MDETLKKQIDDMLSIYDTHKHDTFLLHKKFFEEHTLPETIKLIEKLSRRIETVQGILECQ